MTLPDLRRFCLRRQTRVAFRLRSGKVCRVDEHGATIIDGVAGCLLEGDEFAAARHFEVERSWSNLAELVKRQDLDRMVARVAQAPSTVKSLPLIQSVK